MALPVVAIVGRPNVGKSSLFNWLAGRRIAIVDATAGVTRDRLTALVKVEAPSGNPRYFELVDTGGLGVEDVDRLTPLIERQIQVAIDEANLVLFVVDTRTGPTPLDEEVAVRLRPIAKPVIVVANKSDTATLEQEAAEFHRWGIDALVPVSAQQNRGKESLLGKILQRLPKPGEIETPPEAALKLAIVGRRNTGKSTFINCLAQSERTIVSEVPGTTRDSIDVHFQRDGKRIIAIDTAGVRRKGSIRSDIDFYGVARAERSIRRADVVLLFFDARWRVSKVDKQLAGYILEHHKPAIFVVNKWDLMAPMPTGRFVDYLRAVFPSLDFVPLAFLSAKEGRNVSKVVNLAQHLHKQAGARVSTSDLNRVVRLALAQQAPPLRQNRRPKIYYATQVAVHPPTVVLFTNDPELFDNTYRRFLLKMFRDHLPFNDVPMKLYLRHRQRAGWEERESEERNPAGIASAVEVPRREGGKKSASRPSRSKVKPKTKKPKRGEKGSELWQD